MARKKPYLTAADLRAVVPDANRDAALADTLGGAQADPGLLAGVLAAASDEVDALIEGRIRLPLAAVPQKVKTAALYIALEVLYLRRGLDLPEFQAKKVTFWREWLSKVGEGELRLEADAAAAAAKPGGAISGRKSVTGSGLIGSILLAFCFSLLPMLGNATPPRSFEFEAPDYPTIEIADYVEWFQGESVELVYTDVRPDGREVRWEVSETTNLWMNLAPVGQTAKAWTFFANPWQTVLPAGRYNGRVAVYERQETNLVFHRVVAQQEITVHPARDPDTLILASPLATIFDPAIVEDLTAQADRAEAAATAAAESAAANARDLTTASNALAAATQEEQIAREAGDDALAQAIRDEALLRSQTDTALQQALEGHASTLTSHADAIELLQAADEAIREDITGLGERVTTTEDSITTGSNTLAQALTDHAGNNDAHGIADVRQNLSAVSARVETAEGNIQTNAAAITSISTILQRDTGTEGLLYAALDDGLWVVGYTGTESSVVIPAYAGSNKVQGITADATGLGAITNLVVYAPKMEVRHAEPEHYTDGVWLTRMEAAITHATNLVSVYWLADDAELSGLFYPDCLRRNMSRREQLSLGFIPKQDGDHLVLRRNDGSGILADKTGLITFVAPGLKYIPYAMFARTALTGEVDLSGVEAIGERGLGAVGMQSFRSDNLREVYTHGIVFCRNLTNLTITSRVKLRPHSLRNNGAVDVLRLDTATYVGRNALDATGSTNLTTITFNEATEVLSLPQRIQVVHAPKAKKLYIKNRWETLREVYANSLDHIPAWWSAPHKPPHGVWGYPGYKFKKWAALEVVVADSATYIGEHAFSRCTNLNPRSSFRNVVSIHQSAFRDSLVPTGPSPNGAGPLYWTETFKNVEDIKHAAFRDSRIRGYRLMGWHNAAGVRRNLYGVGPEVFPRVKSLGTAAFAGADMQYFHSTATDVKHSLFGTMGTGKKGAVTTNLVSIVLNNADKVGGSLAANCPNVEQFRADKARSLGGYMLWGTKFNFTHWYWDKAAEAYKSAVSFGGLSKTSPYAFAYATNMPEFNAPLWTNPGGLNGTFVSCYSLTNVFAPNLYYYSSNMTIGATNLQQFIWRGNYVPEAQP